MGNSVKALCIDGVMRTATFRGERDTPVGRAFVRVWIERAGCYVTVNGICERNIITNVYVFRADPDSKNSNVIVRKVESEAVQDDNAVIAFRNGAPNAVMYSIADTAMTPHTPKPHDTGSKKPYEYDANGLNDTDEL